MSAHSEHAGWVASQLEDLGTITARPMFGCTGLYADGLFFAILDGDATFFKVATSNRAEFDARDMPAFQPPGRPCAMSYRQVPDDVAFDAHELVAWARRALEAARQQPKRRAT